MSSPNNIDEDPYLENHSYWDIDLLEEYNAPIRRRIRQVEAKRPKTFIGRLWQRFVIFKLKKKLHTYVQK